MSYHTCTRCTNSFHLKTEKMLPSRFICSTCFSTSIHPVKDIASRTMEQRSMAIQERLVMFLRNPQYSNLDVLFEEIESIMNKPVPEDVLKDYDTFCGKVHRYMVWCKDTEDTAKRMRGEAIQAVETTFNKWLDKLMEEPSQKVEPLPHSEVERPAAPSSKTCFLCSASIPDEHDLCAPCFFNHEFQKLSSLYLPLSEEKNPSNALPPNVTTAGQWQGWILSPEEHRQVADYRQSSLLEIKKHDESLPDIPSDFWGDPKVLPMISPHDKLKPIPFSKLLVREDGSLFECSRPELFPMIQLKKPQEESSTQEEKFSLTLTAEGTVILG